MRAAGLFVAISSVQALAPTAKRRDIGAFLGGAALTTLAPRPALADVKIDPNSVRTTKGGAKYVVVKEGACPLIDPSGALGSCYPAPESYITIDYTGFLPNGQVFDSTEKKGGKPLSFRLGERQVVPGIVLCGNKNLTARSSTSTPSTRRLLDGVAMPVPHRSTEPARPRKSSPRMT